MDDTPSTSPALSKTLQNKEYRAHKRRYAPELEALARTTIAPEPEDGHPAKRCRTDGAIVSTREGDPECPTAEPTVPSCEVLTMVEQDGQIIQRVLHRGSQSHCLYTFTYRDIDAPLPFSEYKRLGRTQRRVASLPILEGFTKRRPAVADGTLRRYIERACAPKSWVALDLYKIDMHLGSRLPSARTKHLYTIYDRYVMVDYTREVTCPGCGKKRAGMQGRHTTSTNTFRFRPCCYKGDSSWKKVGPGARVNRGVHKPYRVCHQAFYDIEATPDPQTGVHRFYLAVVKSTMDDTIHTARSASELIKIFGDYIERLGPEAQGQETTTLLQLVSFNGSRYDDVFLAEYWRIYILNRWGLDKLLNNGYSERKRAITHNTLHLPQFEIVWTDVARMTPPTSLRNLAKSLKLDEQKGDMPFAVLNDFVDDALRRDPEDGFFARDYFPTEGHRERCLEYYREVVPVDERTPRRDVYALCLAYCRQDVVVLQKIFEALNEMYTSYLGPLVYPPPGDDDDDEEEDAEPPPVFYPMTMHSLSTLSARVMLETASKVPCLHYDSSEGGSDRPFTTSVINKEALMAPRGRVYDYLSRAIYGGWTKNYLQGFVTNLDPTLPTWDDTCKLLARCREEGALSLVDAPHEMFDIASMYPVAITGMMPMGEGQWIGDAVAMQGLFDQLVTTADVAKIPLFFARCKLEAPVNPPSFESTLPQRHPKTNQLRWTYFDDPSGELVYTSLDLWIACRDQGYGPASTWTPTDFIDMLYFEVGAQCYRAFMEACSKGKADGTKEKNLQKRTTFKIAMNAAIGKLGQSVEAQTNILGSLQASNFIDQCGGRATLLGTRPVTYMRGIAKYTANEFIFKTRDNDSNNWLPHHAAFMYSWTRLMRLQWTIRTQPGHPLRGSVMRCLSDPTETPDTLYGDTDSKIQLQRQSELLPASMRGDIVGALKPELPLADDWRRPSRPFFQLEPEKISEAPLKARVTGVLAPKKYFVFATDDTLTKFALKFRCNGLSQFESERGHSCPLHNCVECSQCSCPHKNFCFMCFICVSTLLNRETYEADDVTGVWGGKEYKYSLRELRTLTLLDFVRVLSTGRSCATLSNGIDHTLSLPTSKLPSYVLINKAQTRSLNRPRALRTHREMLTGVPEGQFQDTFMSGLISLPTHPHCLFPAGTYLEVHGFLTPEVNAIVVEDGGGNAGV
jgi:DNA polymerase type B, organellar and viral